MLKHNFKTEYFNYPNEKFDVDKVKKFYTNSTNKRLLGVVLWKS